MPGSPKFDDEGHFPTGIMRGGFMQHGVLEVFKRQP
jgi:hypothetical protein